MKKFLLAGIVLILALAFAPKANAYPFACDTNWVFDTSKQNGRTIYWEGCQETTGGYDWAAVSWLEWNFDRYVDRPD